MGSPFCILPHLAASSTSTSTTHKAHAGMREVSVMGAGGGLDAAAGDGAAELLWLLLGLLLLLLLLLQLLLQLLMLLGRVIMGWVGCM